VTERGWSSDPSVTLRHRVVIWLAQHQRDKPGSIASNGDVAEALGQQGQNVAVVTDALASEGLCIVGPSMRTDSAPVQPAPGLDGLASRWLTSRSSKRERSVACRDAMLEWLYEDGHQASDVSPFLADQRAAFFGERFTRDEAVAAMDHLVEVGLVQGSAVAWGGSVLRPFLTAAGRTCAEQYDCRVSDWLTRQAATPTITISNSQGVNIATSSPGAQQTVTITTDARRLMVQTADALEATLPVLGLDDEEVARAHEIAERLRAEAEQDEDDPKRLHGLLKDVRTVAVSGTGSAGGVGIVALAQQIAQALPW
jgi:hypothetical protein